jgi:lysophospholipase L1-like esterase
MRNALFAKKRTAAGRRRPALERLEDRTLPAVTIAALGDSLTAPYAGNPWGAAGDRNWVEQLRADDGRHVVIDDLAVAGETSASLLARGQDAAAADLVAHHAVRYAVLIVGANDVSAHLSDFVAGNPGAFVTDVVANIEKALDDVAAAGRVRLAVATIPDVTLTPAFQAEVAPFGPDAAAALTQEISAAIAAANQQIEAFAADREIPVIDLAGLGKLAAGGPFVVGGVDVAGNFYAPDGFHPGTVGQGVLADAVLAAFARESHDPRLLRLRLTDQQILDDAGVPHAPGRTYFDVGPYILFHDADAGLCAALRGLDRPSGDDPGPSQASFGHGRDDFAFSGAGRAPRSDVADQLFARGDFRFWGVFSSD